MTIDLSSVKSICMTYAPFSYNEGKRDLGQVNIRWGESSTRKNAKGRRVCFNSSGIIADQ